MLIAGIMIALPQLIRAVAWTVAVVFAAVMAKDCGERAERCFLAGTCLMLVSSVVASAAAGLMPWLMSKLAEATHVYTGIVSLLPIIHIVNSVVAAGGIALLVYAFWSKFRNASTTFGSD